MKLSFLNGSFQPHTNLTIELVITLEAMTMVIETVVILGLFRDSLKPWKRIAVVVGANLLTFFLGWLIIFLEFEWLNWGH